MTKSILIPIRRLAVRLTGLVLIATVLAGCDHGGGSSNKGLSTSKNNGFSTSKNNSSSKRTMSAHSGKFSKGYQDGMKDARTALGDISGAWSWLWLTEKDYHDGYDRGWKDGREMARLQKNQSVMRARNDAGRETQKSLMSPSQKRSTSSEK